MIAWLFFACSTPAPEAEAAARHAPNPSAVRVEVATLHRDPELGLSMSLPGEVEGSRDVLLSAALGGQVEQILIQRGDAVRRGQGIARIDSEIYQAQYDQANAHYEQAVEEAARIKKLGDLATASQILQVRTTVKITDAQRRAAGAQLKRAVIRAPFSGTVADIFPNTGEFLGPGSPVARVVTLDPVHISLAVADRDVVSLEPGLKVTVNVAATGTPSEGTVIHVGKAADLRTRAFPVDVELPNPSQRLLPGMIASVDVHRALPEGVLTIPQDWIVSGREGQGVFLERDGFAKWQPITLGEVLREQVVVESGLAEGARVIVTGHRDLVDGDTVLISREGVCCTNGRQEVK